MVKILLASHGDLADGVYSTLKIIMGDQENISTLCAYKEENFDLNKTVLDIIAKLSSEDELIIVTDIYGGSINNEFMNYLEEGNIHLVAGLNLPLIMELLFIKDNNNIENMIEIAIENSKNTIQYCNKTVKTAVLEDECF